MRKLLDDEEEAEDAVEEEDDDRNADGAAMASSGLGVRASGQMMRMVTAMCGMGSGSGFGDARSGGDRFAQITRRVATAALLLLAGVVA